MLEDNNPFSIIDKWCKTPWYLRMFGYKKYRRAIVIPNAIEYGGIWLKQYSNNKE